MVEILLFPIHVPVVSYLKDSSTTELQATLLYEDLSRKINGAAIEVHREPVTLSDPGPERHRLQTSAH